MSSVSMIDGHIDNDYVKILEDLHNKILNDKCLAEKVDHNELYTLFHIRSILERQNAEIERLKNAYKQCAWERDIFSEEHKFCNLLGNTLVFSKNLKDYNDMRKGLKAEAIKEFAERLKEKSYEIYGTYEVVDVSDIDSLVEIMTPI